MSNNKNKLVYFAAVMYAIITGLSPLFVKVSLQAANPADALAHRFTAAFIGILIPILFGWVKLDYNWENVKKIIPLAILNPLLFFGFQTTGLQYASSAEAGILLASSPVFTMILASYFLNEKNTTMQKLSIITSVLGVVYITLMKSSNFDFNNILGIILLLLSALSIAGYSVMARTLTRDFSSTELSCIMVVISFISYNVIAIIKHISEGTLKGYFVPFGDFRFVMSILYLGVLSSFISSLLTNYILSKIEASRMIVFTNLATVISIVAGVVFLQEDIYYYHIIGSILIIGGVIGTNYFRKNDTE